MSNYIKEFIERNRGKPFVKNLARYDKLNIYGRAKVVSSFLTHLIIDKEHGADNWGYIVELMSILNEIILYNLDDFVEWLESYLKGD